jgi:nucleotide-binding universal stress UspA family protein
VETKHVLVPLDGSRLAECVLPAAAYLAAILPASVTLLHIIEHHAPPAVHSEHHLTRPDEAQAYLDAVAARSFPAGVSVARHVHTNEVRDVAGSLVAHASELRPDLIVMCSHGRTGWRQRLFGSIAQKIINHCPVPVLLIQPGETGPTVSFRCKKMLVPLDGDPDHERGLAAAEDWARLCGAALHLAAVVPTPGTLGGEQAAAGRLLPLSMTALLDLDEASLAAYLQRHVQRLERAGLHVTAESERGDPAVLLIASAERVQADLIVLGTHGRAGLDAFWSGSLTPKVVSRTRIPLLMVPLHP